MRRSGLVGSLLGRGLLRRLRRCLGIVGLGGGSLLRRRLLGGGLGFFLGSGRSFIRLHRGLLGRRLLGGRLFGGVLARIGLLRGGLLARLVVVVIVAVRAGRETVIALDRGFQLLAGRFAIGDLGLVEQEVDDLVLTYWMKRC